MWSFFLVFGLLFWGSHGSVTCRDERDAAVDWYILYKAPKMNSLSGTEYIYIDSTKRRGKLNNINSPEEFLANTLKPLFGPIRDMAETFGFIIYSDQPPGSSANPKKFGHSKGIVMVEKDSTGVWISHSTPQFPFRRNQNNFWPKSGNKNAQTFICVTFNYIQFAKIGRHLQHIHAFPYENYIPDNFHEELKEIMNWTEDPPTPSTEVHTESLTLSNVTFKTFAKRTSDNEEDGDLYVSIASDIKSSVYAQSWRCKPDSSYSYCSGYEVINVEDVTIDNSWRWKPKSDHSKWCVAKDQNKHWTCIGDMNREESQYKRYGGALCIQNEQVQTRFLAFAKPLQTCRKRPRQDCDLNIDGDDFRQPIIIDHFGLDVFDPQIRNSPIRKYGDVVERN